MYYDLIIVGGGLVGAGLAISLRQSELRIALVDARNPSQDDPRLIALNASSCQFLKNLGVWSALSAHAAPIHQVHVSRRGHFGSARLDCKSVHLPQLGNVIPAHFIESALNDELLSLPNVTLYRPAKLKHLCHKHQQVELILETNEHEITLQSAIVIGADGTESTVRTQLNMGAEMVDYKQSAIVTCTKLSRSHQQIAYERFNETGAIAMLPLIDHECATIWTADNAMISQLMALDDQAFLETLQKEFGYRLGRLQAIRKRHVYPLKMMRAEKTVDQCVLLLGNAAHTLHPIAAQGFNLALYEVAILVESILQCLTKKMSIASLDLAQISAQSQKQQAISMGLSHRLSHLFASDSLLINAVLQLGMIGFDVTSPIKKKFIQNMLGRAGSVPRLLMSSN